MPRLRYVVLAVAIAFVGWVGWQAYGLYDAVQQTTGKVEPRTAFDFKVTPVPFGSNSRINILLLGSDDDKKTEETKPPSQSIIVVTIDPAHNRVGLLSIPRDFWVPVRGHGMSKIQLAYKYGGVPLARETVERLFGIRIDYYAWVGLNGFIKVIDLFNGVTIDVSHPILDDTYPDDLNAGNPYAFKRLFIPAGWQHMDGTRALEYVRSRHGDLISDFGRSARQQQVLLDLRHKITTIDLLRNLPSLIHDLVGTVRTDLRLDQLNQLRQIAGRIGDADIHQVVLSVPTYSSYGFTSDRQSIVIPNWPKIRPVVARMFAPIATSSPAPRTLRPGILATAGPGSTKKVTPPVVAQALPTRSAPPTPEPTATTVTPSVSRLPATLIYVVAGNLFEMLPDSSVRQLTFSGDAAMPSPAPDGKSIAFIRYADHGNAGDLWLLDLKSLRQTQVTHDVAPNQVQNDRWAAWPSWSSDGHEVVISTDTAKLTQAPSELRPVDLALWLQPLTGSQPTQVTVPARGAGGDTEPTWRPGSNQVVYVHWDYLQPSDQPYSQIDLHDPAVAGPIMLTPIGGRVLQPTWDPKGKRLVFQRLTNGVDEISVAPLVQTRTGPQLGSRTVLARGQVTQPAFTPDGRYVSYLRVDGDGFDLYLVSARGGPAAKIGALDSSIDATSRPVWLK